MMKKKKNAIVPEIFRARSSQVLGDLVGAIGLVKALPLSYNLDLQELTRNLWSAVDKTTESVLVLAEVVEAMRFNTRILLAATSSDDFLYSTELADYLVAKLKIPFREAHGRIGKLVRLCSNDHTNFRELGAEKVSKELGVEISQTDLDSITDPRNTLMRRSAIGSPNPKLVSESSKKRRSEIAKHERTLYSLQKGLVESQKMLISAADKMKQVSHSLRVSEGSS